MIKEEIQKLPLAARRDMYSLVSIFEDLFKSNSDIILRIEVENNNILEFKSIENDDYTFTITSPQINSRHILYSCAFKPSNEINFEPRIESVEMSPVVTYFKLWIELLRELSKYQNLLSEPFLKEYTDEFFAEFEFIEEVDDSEPYETQKQIALYDALVKLESNLKSQEQTEVLENITKDIIHLKENIQNISKGATKKRVAKIFAKIKKGGIKLFKDVVEVGYKEIIKAALHQGTDAVGNLLT